MADKEPKYFTRRAAQLQDSESQAADDQHTENTSHENIAETSLIDVSVTTPTSSPRNVGNMQSPIDVNIEKRSVVPSGVMHQPMSRLEEFMSIPSTSGQTENINMSNQPPTHMGNLPVGNDLCQGQEFDNVMGLRGLASHTPEGASVILRRQPSPVCQPVAMSNINHLTSRQVTMTTNSQYWVLLGIILKIFNLYRD